jgi:hypothetical protein
MWTKRLFSGWTKTSQAVKSAPRRTAAKPGPVKTRLGIESLEDRVVMNGATLTAAPLMTSFLAPIGGTALVASSAPTITTNLTAAPPMSIFASSAVPTLSLVAAPIGSAILLGPVSLPASPPPAGPSAEMFDGLEFYGTFVTQGSQVSSTSPVEVGVAPQGGAAFVPLLTLQGGVQFTAGDPTGTFTTNGEVDATVGGTSVQILDAHAHTFDAPDLLAANGLTLASTDTNATQVAVAGGALTVTGLALQANAVELQGTLSIPSLAGFTLPVVGQGSATISAAGTQLDGFDATLTQPESFTFDGVSITLQQAEVRYDAAGDAYDISGSASATFGDTTIGLSLGDAANPGLVIANGQVEALAAGVTGGFTAAGLGIDANNLGFDYNATANDFSLYGAVSVTTADGALDNLTGTLGTIDNPGLVIANGQLQSLDVGLSGSFNLFGLTATAESLTIDYSTSLHQLELSGGVGVRLTSGLVANAAIAEGGLLIDTSTGALSFDTRNGFDVRGSLALGSYGINDLDIHFADVNGQTDVTAGGTLDLGEFSVASTLDIVGGRLNDIGVDYHSTPGIEVGETGLFITDLNGTIDNLTDPAALVVRLGATVEEGPTNALLVATGTITASANSFDLNGSVQLLGGLIQANADLYVSDVNGQFAAGATISTSEDNGIFQFTGALALDGSGDLTLDATATVNLPNSTPDFVREAVEAINNGSDQLAGVAFHLQIEPGQAAAQTYAEGDLLVGSSPLIGVRVDAAGDFSLTGSGAGAFAAALAQLGDTAEQVGAVLRDSFSQDAQQAAQSLQAAGYAVADVGATLAGTFNQTDQQTAQVLQNLGYGAADIGSVLANQFGDSAQQVAQTFQSIGANIQQAAQGLAGAGYYGNDAIAALQSLYAPTAAQLAGALQTGLGYSQSEVANALGQAGFTVTQVESYFAGLGKNALQTAQLLSDAGFSVATIANTLIAAEPGLASAAAELQLVSILSRLNVFAPGVGEVEVPAFNATQIAQYAVGQFGSTPERVAGYLHQAGAPLYSIAQMLTHYGMSLPDVANFLYTGLGLNVWTIQYQAFKWFNYSQVQNAIQILDYNISTGFQNVANAVEAVAQEVEQAVQEAEKEAEQLAQSIAQSIEDVLNNWF